MMVIIRSGPEDVWRVADGLRLCAAMLGMDRTPRIVHLNEGVKCLLPGALQDPTIRDYLRTSADLAGIHVLVESLKENGMRIEDLDPVLSVTTIDIRGLAEMMAECGSTVTF
jgi:sulfur relay (sulfurtransferase) DsrF/TusC family protein